VKDTKKGSPPDSFLPTNVKIIAKMLKTIDTLSKRACYVTRGSRAALLIAEKLVTRNKPIQVGFLQEIADLRPWAKQLEHMPLRFLPQYDGVNIAALMELK